MPLDPNCTQPQFSAASAPPTSSSDHLPPSIPDDGLLTEKHPNQPFGFSGGLNLLQKMETDQYSNERITNIYYPFRSKEEWHLAKFLAESRLPQAQINQFLKLDEVQ